MPHIDDRTLEQALRVDLLSYLESCDPGNLVRLSGSCWCTREHDSLKISNGKWYWFSRGTGGVSAVDYLVKVRNYPFIRAVEEVAGRTVVERPSFSSSAKIREPGKLTIPDLEDDPVRVRRYLEGRGIHPKIIDYCVGHSLLFETSGYHNALFVGYDNRGIARYAALRGTLSDYKVEAPGSDKRFSFSFSDSPRPENIHLFESAIDAMSYASLAQMEGREWRTDAFLSLAGVYRPSKKETVPAALSRYLDDCPPVKGIRLHLDNDEAGRGAADGIICALSDRYPVRNEPPDPRFKDVNDQLKERIIRMKKKEDPDR